MTRHQIRFARPPVTEAVLGVQFDPLAGYSTAHAGWFWRRYLESWPVATDAPRLPDVSEEFPPNLRPSAEWQVSGIEPHRTQLVKGQRMVQLQDSRLVLNWISRQGEGEYPTFDVLLAEFRTILRSFDGFVNEAELGGLRLNLWEVTYVNEVPRGELWSEREEWSTVIKSTDRPLTAPDFALEGASSQWRYALPGNRGRLRIVVQNAQLADEGPEVLLLKLVARGPIDNERDLESGLDLGHVACETAFLGMTSPRAQESWGGR